VTVPGKWINILTGELLERTPCVNLVHSETAKVIHAEVIIIIIIIIIMFVCPKTA